MSASNSPIGDVVEGIVDAANGRDVKVGGDWRNVSPFHRRPARSRRSAPRTRQHGFIGSPQILILLANSCDQMAMSRANFEWRVLELGVSVSQASMR
jgi:hypothetical protein